MDSVIDNIFTNLYITYRDSLQSYVYFRTSDWHVSEDIVHNIYLKTWKYLHEDHNINNEKNFLYAVARNLLVDFYRQKEKQPILISISMSNKLTDENQQNKFDNIINLVLFERYLKKLKPRDRKILKMRYIDRLDIKEISEKTGLSRNYISVMINRSSKKIKRQFQKP